jgi:hypothetical protein
VWTVLRPPGFILFTAAITNRLSGFCFSTTQNLANKGRVS